ncbi:hypothetical protein J5N97_017442 [Dioscorea zingiberensis]|uniref:WRKY domain-containing protein n=1 Tax=Dioscorea zingiberensis TaxID=325984 RepID=A0A9D5CN70_9LILI|nr:hypothetical protein J5N97_017442 [Dioscorea zingiberensis]
MGSLEKEISLPAASGSLKLVTEELIMKGQEMLNKLESLLVDEGVKKLLAEFRGSVARARTFLESGEPSEVCQDSDRRSEISSRKRKLETLKQGKGGSRRRMSSYPSRRVTSKTHEDGFSWRKYGQKEIFGSKCPRSYFRCTHKHDRNCQATRQVQKSEEDPSFYVITYMGEHTCRDPIDASHEFLLAPNHSPCLISFGASDHCENIQQQPFASFPSLKQELDEEVISNMTPPGGSPSDFFMSSEFAALDVPIPEMAPCKGTVSEHGDEASGLHSSATSLEMEIMPELLSSYDILNFDHVGFFEN